MSAYKTQQHRLVHRGRAFHLVSYEGQPADVKTLRPETPPCWYLMLSGKRWMVCPQASETTPEELDSRFGAWLDAHVFGDGRDEGIGQARAVDAPPSAAAGA